MDIIDSNMIVTGIVTALVALVTYEIVAMLALQVIYMRKCHTFETTMIGFIVHTCMHRRC